MKEIHTIAEMSLLRQQPSGSLGFVPTMGYLHEGHLSLVRKAKAENQAVAVSIFVNPTQFGRFLPAAEEIYPQGFNSWVKVEGVTERLEGASRPGHFQGVTTVVAKLFNIVRPDRAYFGQKDAQQAIVIKKMAADLNMSVEITVLPTVREPDGLAMSSRNSYLNAEERRSATVLFKALTVVRERYERGERNADLLRQEMISLIQGNPLARIDYVSIADRQTLEELSNIDRPALVSLAVRIGKTRLIDNILLG